MLIDRKKEIIKAAGACFSKYGYDKTTLDDISHIVGINKASFYYYFKSKEEIFTELITEEADRFIQKTIQVANKVKKCKQRILKWISYSFLYLQSNSILYQLSNESLKNLSPYLKELVNYSKQQGTAYLINTLNHFISQGDIKTINTEQTAQVIQNIIYALKDYLYKQHSPQTVSKEEQKQIVKEIIEAVSLILDGIIIKKEGI